MDWSVFWLTALACAILASWTLWKRGGSTAPAPDPTPPPKKAPAEWSPQRAASLLYITTYVQRAIDQGWRVRALRPIDRYPHFEVQPGATGRLLHPLSDPADDRLVLRVQLDVPPPGAALFNGEVHWKEGPEFNLFEKDLGLYRPEG